MDRSRVLVIDDEAGPRESLRMILKDTYDVTLAENPIQGLKLADQQRPDVVFLDIKMPEMEGTEVLRRIKEIDPDIEVVMFTAFAAVDSAQLALRYGAIDYLTKPFSVQDIVHVAQRAARRRTEKLRERVLLQQLQPAAQALLGQLAAIGEPAGSGQSSAIFENLTEAHSSIETQLSKVARLNAIGEIAAEVAHDVSNFLTAILLRIEMLLMNLKQTSEVDAETIRDALGDIIQAARDGAQAVQRISGISKSDPYEPASMVDLNTVISEVVGLGVGQSSGGDNVQITVDSGPIPPVFGSPSALRTAIMNIVINARQALEEGGEVSIHSLTEGEDVVVQVRDTGAGIPPDIVHRLTEPFFTTKGERGSGLGLSVARKVIARHEGSLSFESEEGRGTTVTIRLPAATAVPVEQAASRRIDAVPDVLLVDDDRRLLGTLQASLIGAGLSVEGAGDAAAGLQTFENCLREHGHAPAVLIVDLRMPGLLGTDMARRIKAIAPRTRVILISAYVAEDSDIQADPYLDAVIKKPFPIAQLLREIRVATLS
jgi:signal transduction histidine kinase